MALLGVNWTIQEPDDEREWPDLVIETATGPFGLEIRKLYADEVSGGSSRRAAESSRTRFLKEVASTYYERGAPPVRVQCYGMPDDLSRFADDLAAMVPVMQPWERKKVTYDGGRWVHVCRLRAECGEYSRWDVVSDSVGWVGVIDPSIVQAAIQAKSINLPRYKVHVEDVRLLLVCDRTRNSGKHLFGHLPAIERAGFNNIYLLSFPDEIYQIPALCR